MLDLLPVQPDPNLLVGHNGADDAGVYRLDDNTALVLTVDFFTPIVDDPFDYGRVAAANSLSDVYAMGGRPLVALNIAGFPEGVIGPDVLAEILRGGAAVAKEAGIVIAGGHTVSDKELKYGLAVVGLIRPDRIIQNSGATPGDDVILTKPLGTGVLTTESMQHGISDEELRTLVDVMTRLNRDASHAMIKFGAHASTDVTGYGLLGHAYEMARESGVTIEIDAGRVPVLPGAMRSIGRGCLTAGGGTNRSFVGDDITWKGAVGDDHKHLLFDPQTSGGLLIAVPAGQSEFLLEALRSSAPEAAVVGKVRKKADTLLEVV